MKPQEYSGRLKRYMKLPLYLIAVFAALDIGLFFVDSRLAQIFLCIVLAYALIAYILYGVYLRKFEKDLIGYAVHYGVVQNKILTTLRIPFVLLDANGKIIWMNEEFGRVTEKGDCYDKSISGIFKEITKDMIGRIGDEPLEVKIDHNDRKYTASIKKITITEDEFSGNEGQVSIIENLDSLVEVVLFDETEYQKIKQINEDKDLVLGLIYIDNYDEVFETVESTKRSMLLALIDRRISKYFKNSDAVVRKMDDDKYFVLFQYKYLKAMEEDNFSLLEDIKSIKMGNEIEITISMGLGLNGNRYTQNAEYAHTAIDLALARGGSQVVIKKGSAVSYYGSRGKEVEKNTRVKARIKAQALKELMEAKENVIIMGHSISDADCLGAAVGVYCAARQIGKPTHIVLNTITSSMRPVVESFTSKSDYPENLFVNSDQALDIVSSNTLVVVVDTARLTYVDCPDLLKRSKSIVVFDHHRQNEDPIENPTLSYIEPYASSACEMIAEVLQYFAEKVEINPTEADALYAGILIDTSNFMTKTGVRTFEAAAFLRRNGAEVTRVRKLLREDMNTYKARAEVVRNAEVYKGLFAISICEPDAMIESPTVLGAKAANELLNIVGIKASFVLTEFDGRVFISSRSIDEIDVQKIMERLGGGGHLNIAGAQVKDTTVNEVKESLEKILDEMLEKGDIKL